jgi:RHS repeat-associated protein
VFAVNNLNQLSTGTRNGKLTVAGTSGSAATNVTVNSSNAIRYADSTFVLTNVALVNGTNTFTAIAKDNLGRIDTNIVTAYLPTNVVFQYDANGNLVFDGLRAFDYDDENQLTRVTVTNSFKSEFAYDGKMRRRIRREYLWQLGAWRLNQEVHYVYDGNLVVEERDALNVPTLSYTWGRDLSGSLEGAGGIGGLLALSQLSTVNPQHFYYHADGNGNITALVNSLQNVVAKYLYDPFGNTLSASGPLADVNLYRFSSKEFHPASGLVCYLYRYYDSGLQRWENRDPLGEIGHRVIRGACGDCYAPFSREGATFRFCGNAPTLQHDSLGLVSEQDCQDAYDSAMKKAKQAGSKCLTDAIKHGVIGEVIFAGGGAVIGAIIGKVPGAGIGLVLGTGANLIVDVCQLKKCEKEVDKMKQDAKNAYDDCMKKLDE